MNRSLSLPETPESRSLSAPASTVSDIHGALDPPVVESDSTGSSAKVDRGGKVIADAGAVHDQGNQGPLSALERFPPMTARDELSNTLLRKGEPHSIESLVGPYVRSDSGAEQQQGPNDPASPLAQRQLSEIPQSPHLTASPSRPVTPLASIQEPDSGETGAQGAEFGVACSGDRSTLHEESHPQDALIDNPTSDDEEEHSGLSNRSYTAILTSLSGESPKSPPTRAQDQIPLITDRPSPVRMPTTPIKKSLSGPGLQRVCLNSRAELPSYSGPDASVANFSEGFVLDPCPLSPGEVRSPIRGTVRKRQAMDDFPGNMRKRYRGQWEDLCAKDRDERGAIDGYESGDSELEFSEWEDAKERRRKKRKL